MAGNAPRLPPGISVQRAAPAPPPPNLPPGISIGRADTGSAQRSAGMDRLAGLGIQVSRSEEPDRSNQDMDKLSKLGISVGRSSQEPPKLPPGMNISGGPRPNLPPGMVVSGGPRPNLPPGMVVSGGPRTNLPPGMNISGGPRPNLPPGMNVSGGPRPNLPPGMNISGGPRPSLPPGVNISGGPQRGPRPNLPPGMVMSGGPRGPRPPIPQRASVSDSEEDEDEDMPPRPHGSQPRPNLPPGMNMVGGPRGPRPMMPRGPRPPPPGGSPGQGGVRQPLPSGPSPAAPGGPQQPAPSPGPPPGRASGGSSPKENGDTPSPQEKQNEPDKTANPQVMESDEGVDEFEDEEDENVNKAPTENGIENNEKKADDAEVETPKEALVNGSAQSEGEENDDKNMDTEEDDNAPAATGQVDGTQEPKEGMPIESEKDKNSEEVESEKEKPSEETNGEKEKEGDKASKEPSNDGANNEGKDAVAEGEEGEEGEDWEGYEGEEGWEGYEGEEGEEGEEGWEGYEGEEGEEGWEGYEDEEGWEEEGGEKSKDPSADNAKDSDKPGDKTGKEAENMETEEDDADTSMDQDGAPKATDDEAPSTPHKLAGISFSRVSTEDQVTPNKKIPPGISMSPVPNLPAGISISSPARPALPEGISISPFKKPSARPSMDEDSQSVGSRGEAVDYTPTVGQDTYCVFCFQNCMQRKPRLLTCLHTACLHCFEEKIRISIRDSDKSDVVGLDDDGDEIQMAPEVTCSICKATTSEDEVMVNHFVDVDEEEEQKEKEDQHSCVSCEESALATSRCNDCEEYLCNDCVRAHQRVKMTKDHEIIVVSSSYDMSAGLNYCDVHTNEKRTLYCESCDSLNCRDCQLSDRHRNHQYRYANEVAPEIKLTLMKSSGDIRLKKNGLEESRGTLTAKLAEINVKENSLLGQLREVKHFLVDKIENKCKELEREVTKATSEKRKLLEGRKGNLDRLHWQADNCLAFVTHVVNGTSDEKMLLTKKMMARQLKRLRRANHAVNIPPADMELKMDLYFQHFTGAALHTNLDNVLKMVMSDIKASTVPIEAPKPKPAPAPAPPPPRQPPSTPTRNPMSSPQGLGRGSPARLNSGMVNRQLGTPQKQVVPRSPQMMRQSSPAGGRGGRGMAGPRMQVMGGGRGGQVAMGGRGRGGPAMRGQPMRGGRGQPMMGQQRGQGAGRPPLAGRGMVRGGQQPQMVRGRGRGQPQMQMRGGQQIRGGVQGMRGAPAQRMMRPAMQAQAPARRGRPPGQAGASQLALQNQQYTNAALGIQPRPKKNPAMQSMGGYQTQSLPPPQQNFNRPIRQAAPHMVTMPPNIQAASPGGSSWHTPSQVGAASGGVSPPSSDITSFKIKLPSMGMKKDGPNGNIMSGVDPLAADAGMTISRVKPERAAGMPSAPIVNPVRNPTDFGLLIDDEISVAPSWSQDGESGKPSNEGSSVKLEGRKPAGGGGAPSKKPEGDWCAICHDGGDTLYCCDRCPKVYHMGCYVPPLPGEPADDWVCLLCSSIDEILSLPTKLRKGRGNLSERDLKLCRRLLLEMYQLWPESVPFRDCADLNFPQYLEKIKDPIALDVIKERLDDENNDQYNSVRSFLADLRKMFRNCFLFNSRESEIYRHAKKLEEKLDQLLQMWLPEFAFDPLTDVVDNTPKSNKRSASPSAGTSKKKRNSDGKRKKKKRKKYDSDESDVESDASAVELL